MKNPKKLNIQIRDAFLTDLAAIHRILNSVLISSTATFEEEPYAMERWKEIFEFKTGKNFPFLVAEIEGVVVGYGTYGPFRQASGYKITVEHSLHVDEKYRGLGIGQTILKELIQQASASKVRNMIAAVDAENTSSIRLHEKFGFQVVGRMDHIARKFSRDLNLVLMQLSL